jgi:hypothetical protein
MSKFIGFKNAAFFLVSLALVAGASAQTVTTVLNFNQSDGAQPVEGRLVQGTDGRFYGTTQGGGQGQDCGQTGCGLLFGVTAQGTQTCRWTGLRVVR